MLCYGGGDGPVGPIFVLEPHGEGVTPPRGDLGGTLAGRVILYAVAL